MGAADVVLAVGTKLGPHDTINEHPALIDPPRQVLIQIDVEPLNTSWTFPIDHVLLADAGYTMDRLADFYGKACAEPSGNRAVHAEKARPIIPESTPARPVKRHSLPSSSSR